MSARVVRTRRAHLFMRSVCVRVCVCSLLLSLRLVWVYSTVVIPGNRKKVISNPCALAEVTMKSLCEYAHTAFDFPDSGFSIVPFRIDALPKRRSSAAAPAAASVSVAAATGATEVETIKIDRDDQLRHHLGTLPVDHEGHIHFSFQVWLGPPTQTAARAAICTLASTQTRQRDADATVTLTTVSVFVCACVYLLSPHPLQNRSSSASGNGSRYRGFHASPSRATHRPTPSRIRSQSRRCR